MNARNNFIGEKLGVQYWLMMNKLKSNLPLVLKTHSTLTRKKQQRSKTPTPVTPKLPLIKQKKFLKNIFFGWLVSAGRNNVSLEGIRQ